MAVLEPMTDAASITADVPGTFDVEVLLFAVHAERVGRAELALTLPQGATVEALRAALRRAGHDALLASAVRFAVNETLVDDDQPIRPGDEVALIPPVAGG